MTNKIFPDLPDSAMVLAAGYGKRLLPMTLTHPKPLIPVGGTALIDHALDHLIPVGVRRAIVNVHYLGEMIEEHLAGRTDPEIIFSREPELLDTGGGVLNALHHFDGQPFLAVNSDMIWRDAFNSSLGRMGKAFDADSMDVLLLLQPVIHAVAYRGMGDFSMRPDGRLQRRRPGRISPFLFTGIQIIHPRIFDRMEVEAFSLNRIYDRAIENGRLFGIRHDGSWADVGHPAGLKAARGLIKGRY
jgi:MurNAc alpha-1-phosphate uridylyltransferase